MIFRHAAKKLPDFVVFRLLSLALKYSKKHQGIEGESRAISFRRQWVKRTISVFENSKIEDFLQKENPALCFLSSCCKGLVVIFCSFNSHLIGCETINIAEISSGVQCFKGKTKKLKCHVAFVVFMSGRSKYC